MWQSSNPALNNNDAFHEYYGRGGMGMTATRPETATVSGVINKTGIFVAIAVIGGGLGYWVTQQVGSFSVTMVSSVAAAVLCIGFGIKLCRKPELAMTLGPIYAIVEGFFLGSLTSLLDSWLAGAGIAVMGGVALQAFIITIGVTLAMLGLYYTRILKPTRLFVSVVSVLTGGILITYLISFVLSLFGTELPLIGLTSAFGNGWTPLIGLGINLLILGVASLWLIIDFKMIESRIAAGEPKSIEWYCAFALLVTLAWIYYEAVKLVFRLAILFNSRD